MRANTWVQDYPLPVYADYVTSGVWPSDSRCMKQVTLPSKTGVTGGTLWVQILDQGLSTFDGVFFLTRYEWRRITDRQFVRLTMRSPLGGGALSETVEIDVPYDSHFFGVTGFATLADFGPVPVLTTEITSTWDLQTYETVYASVPLLLDSRAASRGTQAGVSLAYSVAGRVGLRPGGGVSAILPPGATLASGPGYRLARAAGRQMLRMDGSSRRVPFSSSRVKIALYWSQVGSGGASTRSGWNIGEGSLSYPFTLDRQLVTVAIVQLVSDGTYERVVSAGSFQFQWTTVNDNYTGTTLVSKTASNGGSLPVETFSSSTAGPVRVAGCVVEGEFETDGTPTIAGSDDYTTWPQVSVGVVFTSSRNGVGTGTIQSDDVRRVIPV